MQLHSRSTYAATFTPPHLYCSAHTTILFRCSHAVAFMLQLLCCYIYAFTHAAPMQHSHCSTYAVALTLQHSFPALTPPHWCRCSLAVSFIQHLARHSIFRLQHHDIRRRSHAGAAFTPSHLSCLNCSQQHLRCSSRVDEDLLERIFLCRARRRRAGAGAGERGAGKGGSVFEKGCFGMGWGGMYMPNTFIVRLQYCNVL